MWARGASLGGGAVWARGASLGGGAVWARGASPGEGGGGPRYRGKDGVSRDMFKPQLVTKPVIFILHWTVSFSFG